MQTVKTVANVNLKAQNVLAYAHAVAFSATKTGVLTLTSFHSGLKAASKSSIAKKSACSITESKMRLKMVTQISSSSTSATKTVTSTRLPGSEGMPSVFTTTSSKEKKEGLP